jgi:hypothetical protein
LLGGGEVAGGECALKPSSWMPLRGHEHTFPQSRPMEISLAGELPAIRIASNALRSRESEIEAFLEPRHPLLASVRSHRCDGGRPARRSGRVPAASAAGGHGMTTMTGMRIVAPGRRVSLSTNRTS